MTTTIQIFENAEFGKVRTMTGAEGEALFCGKDVAEALGYKKPENAIATHVEEEDKTSTLIQGNGSNYKSKTIFINESGLYSLILSSKLESARRFKHWVTAEVLPASKSKSCAWRRAWSRTPSNMLKNWKHRGFISSDDARGVYVKSGSVSGFS